MDSEEDSKPPATQNSDETLNKTGTSETKEEEGTSSSQYKDSSTKRPHTHLIAALTVPNNSHPI
jgi:hypothetical protein